MKITVWNENSLEEQNSGTTRAYPKGMQAAIADIFAKDGIDVRIAWQSQEDNGLSEAVLADTDVLIYWAHCKHETLDDATVERICQAVNRGMGAIFLHSAHPSKPFAKMIGASGSLKWREDGRHERLYTVNPDHPIANGLPETFCLKHEEMYGEYFDAGKPDEVVFIGWYPGGEIFRSGLTYHYGEGRIFYFQPGHETFPNYRDANIMKVIRNAAFWVNKQELPKAKSFVTSECSWKGPLASTICFSYKK